MTQRKKFISKDKYISVAKVKQNMKGIVKLHNVVQIGPTSELKHVVSHFDVMIQSPLFGFSFDFKS